MECTRKATLNRFTNQYPKVDILISLALFKQSFVNIEMKKLQIKNTMDLPWNKEPLLSIARLLNALRLRPISFQDISPVNLPIVRYCGVKLQKKISFSLLKFIEELIKLGLDNRISQYCNPIVHTLVISFGWDGLQCLQEFWFFGFSSFLER